MNRGPCDAVVSRVDVTSAAVDGAPGATVAVSSLIFIYGRWKILILIAADLQQQQLEKKRIIRMQLNYLNY